MTPRAVRRAAERQATKQARKAVKLARKAQPVSQPTPARSQPDNQPAVEQTLAAGAGCVGIGEITAQFQAAHQRTNEFLAGCNQALEQEQAEPPASTASEAQINANRENAQKSTGATTPEGKAAVSQNRRTHGFIGNFAMLATENRAEYLQLRDDVLEEYKPQTPTEWRLAQSIMQHYWLMLRADRLQTESLLDPKMLSLYMRYHTTHERSYYRAQKELQKLVMERAEEQIGFEQQTIDQEAHEARIRLQHAKAESIECDNACKKVMGVPIPGIENVPFKDLADACSLAITSLVYSRTAQQAAA